MSTIVVSKSPSVVVRPSEAVTTAGNKSILSLLDKSLITLPTTVLYVFEDPLDEPVETIRRGLSQALAHYCPMAGRLAGHGDDVHVDCNGEGVRFASASANCTIEEIMSAIDDNRKKLMTPLLQELLLYPMERCGRADPLVLMQVTTFSCGGYIVGVTWNHGIADGFGIANFMQTVGELSRGLPTPSVVPVWCKYYDDDNSTSSHQQLVAASVQVPVLPPYMMAVHQVVFEVPVSDLDASSITIPASLINRIRRGGCTLFEAVTAVLWRCRTRTVMLDPETPTVLIFWANARKYMGLNDGYYGNCLAVQIAVEKSGVVADGCDIMDLVGIIRRAKEQIPELFKEKGDAGILQAVGELRGRLGYHNTFSVTSWRNIGLENVDFGSGTPSRVLASCRDFKLPACVVCPLNKGGQEGPCRVKSACVTPQHTDAFLQEIATL